MAKPKEQKRQEAAERQLRHDNATLGQNKAHKRVLEENLGKNFTEDANRRFQRDLRAINEKIRRAEAASKGPFGPH